MPRSQPQILTGTNLSQIINESGRLDSHVQPLCPCSLCYHGRGAGTAVKQGGYSLVILLTREMTFLFNWLFVSCIIHAVKSSASFFFFLECISRGHLGRHLQMHPHVALSLISELRKCMAGCIGAGCDITRSVFASEIIMKAAVFSTGFTQI